MADSARLTLAMIPAETGPGLADWKALQRLREAVALADKLRRWRRWNALVRALERAIDALSELDRPDFARLVYREQLAVYHAIGSAPTGGLGRTLSGLRAALVELARWAEALPVAREELHVWSSLADRDRANTARYWLTRVLAGAGRGEAALESAAAAVAELEEQIAGGATGPIRYDLAHARSEYAARLAHVGRYAEAVPVAAEVADFWRREGAVQRVTALQDLAGALGRVGRYDEARAAFDQALRVARRREFGISSLAIVRGNQGRFLSGIGLVAEAVAAYETAVAGSREDLAGRRDQERRLEEEFAEEPDEWLDHRERAHRDYLRDQARTEIRAAALRLCDLLINLEACLDRLGRAGEAATAGTEAVALAREHGSDHRLALALNNTAVRLDGTGDHDAALTAAGEAVALYAELAAADPQEHTRRHALARHTRCVIVSHLGRHDDALAECSDVVATYRDLHRTDPYGMAADLAAALTDLARIRSRRGEPAAATEAIAEAVRLLAPLAARDPGRHAPALAVAEVVRAEIGSGT
jgi:tetratricopeptide (TPR) repeat protein